MTSLERVGRYRLLRALGRGGMGDVWLAEHEGPEGFARRVALKLLPQGAQADSALLRRLSREARLVSRLVHPNIVALHDFDRDEESQVFYLAMEYVDGLDAKRVMSLLRLRGAPGLELPLVLYVARECLAALAYAHALKDEQGQSLEIVHRDVSPANILISTSGEVKITDFGIAKSRNLSAATTEDFLVGKIPYMSPEQVDDSPLDCRSDLWSLGVVIYELATGVRLFAGRTPVERMAQILGAEIPRLGDRCFGVSEWLESFMARLLERDREKRCASATEALELLMTHRDEMVGAGDRLGDLISRLKSEDDAIPQESLSTSRPVSASQHASIPSPVAHEVQEKVEREAGKPEGEGEDGATTGTRTGDSGGAFTSGSRSAPTVSTSQKYYGHEAMESTAIAIPQERQRPMEVTKARWAASAPRDEEAGEESAAEPDTRPVRRRALHRKDDERQDNEATPPEREAPHVPGWEEPRREEALSEDRPVATITGEGPAPSTSSRATAPPMVWREEREPFVGSSGLWRLALAPTSGDAEAFGGRKVWLRELPEGVFEDHCVSRDYAVGTDWLRRPGFQETPRGFLERHTAHYGGVIREAPQGLEKAPPGYDRVPAGYQVTVDPKAMPLSEFMDHALSRYLHGRIQEVMRRGEEVGNQEEVSRWLALQLRIELGVEVLRQLLAALDELHAKGRVHGALTPDGLLVEPRFVDPIPAVVKAACWRERHRAALEVRPWVKIADWALRESFLQQAEEALERHGLKLVAGKLSGDLGSLDPEEIEEIFALAAHPLRLYGAPEVGRQERDAGAVDDLYFCGVLAFELFTGRYPFQKRSSLTSLSKMLDPSHRPMEVSRLNPLVPDALARWVHWSLEKDPEKRPASPSAARVALEAALTHGGASEGEEAPGGSGGRTGGDERGDETTGNRGGTTTGRAAPRAGATEEGGFLKEREGSVTDHDSSGSAKPPRPAPHERTP